MRRKKRKTSKVPTRVYKYGLLPPTANAELASETFRKRRYYQNQLVTIENARRHRYRAERSRLFPRVAELEARAAVLERSVEEARQKISSGKSASRSRAVDPGLAAEVSRLRAELRVTWRDLKVTKHPIARVHLEAMVAALPARAAEASGEEREKIEKKLDETRRRLAKIPAAGEAERSLVAELDARARAIDEEAALAIKALRPTLFWGTYLLCEEAAVRAASDNPGVLAYDDAPPHRLESRLGIQIQGGMSVAELGSDTRLQIGPMPAFRTRPTGAVFARGAWARTTLRIRVGSDGRRPIWAEFPMVMHRPLPADARIMWAYVTRRPCGARVPWRHELCLVVESRGHEAPRTERRGVVAVNFGWRQMEGGDLRVAVARGEGGGPAEEIRLPARLRSGFLKCRDLQEIMDRSFNEARGRLVAWAAAHDGPEGFGETFAALAAWRSQHRLATWVDYWRDHRFAGDDEIYEVLLAWDARRRHLGDWLAHFRRKLLDQRRDHYRCAAKRLVLKCGRVVVEDFLVSDVARRSPAEEVEEGGEVARWNRHVAAPGELRLAICQAAQKHGTKVVAAESTNNTRRCHACGELYEWDPARELVHTCPGDGVAWDQDENNVENQLKRAASGDVVDLVTPAGTERDQAVGGGPIPGSRRPLRAARSELRNRLKTEENTEGP